MSRTKGSRNHSYLTTTENGDTQYIDLREPLYGIREFDGAWWCDDSGIVFHTEYEAIAMLQAEVLVSRGLIGCHSERIQ